MNNKTNTNGWFEVVLKQTHINLIFFVSKKDFRGKDIITRLKNKSYDPCFFNPII